MLCSDCKKNLAVIKITKTIKGKEPEILGYCYDCAKKRGLSPGLDDTNVSGMSPEVFEILGDKLSDMSPEDLDSLNSQFGSMLNDLTKTLAEHGVNLDDVNIEYRHGKKSSDDDESEEDPDNVDGIQSPMGFAIPIGSFFSNSANKNDEENSSSKKTTVKTEKKTNNNKKRKYLNSFGTNLTDKARNGEIDKVIGRDREISRIVQILNRRTKNNPCLIGEPGVGKTAIAQGLAMRIVNSQVPAKLLKKDVYLLDMTAIVAGTQFRGQFESRMKAIIDECKSDGNVILVIDEVHNIIGAGDSDHAMNAANILKPSLADGSIQIIGTTTLNEYRKHIEKDSALERRFQPVMVEEPSVDDAISILIGIKPYYEQYHKVKISNDVIKKLVVMSEKYIHDRFLPDKAIDVLDEACSRINLDNKDLYTLEVLKNKLQDILSQKEEAASADSTDDYKKAAELKMQECSLTDQIKELERKMVPVELSVEDIAKVIEGWTKIPVQKITEEETKKLLELENNLHNRVIGQNDAVSAVSKAIRRNRAGLKSTKRPPSFIFVGPTGVGKTELAKSLAYEVFGDEDAVIRVDMSEFMESHSTAKLIGAPPGYVGYDDASQLTEKVKRHPYSIVLLDEIEKAHPDVLNLMLQILEDGILTDSQGRKINFRNSIIIMTSNIGARKIVEKKKLGFSNNENIQEDEYIEIKKSVMQEVKKELKPEFINRLDELIIFHKLEREELKQIVSLMLDKLLKRLNSQQYYLEIDDSVKELIIDKGYDKEFGARPIRRALQNYLEDILADEILNENIKKNEKKCILANRDKIIVK